MGKYIENLEESVQSILNEGLADEAAEFLGIEKEEAEARIKPLDFVEYIELANALQMEDEEIVRSILELPIDESQIEEVAPLVGMAARAAGAAVGKAVADKVVGEDELEEGFFDMFKQETTDEDVAQWAAVVMQRLGRHKAAEIMANMGEKGEYMRQALGRYMQANPKGEFAPEVSWVVKGYDTITEDADDADCDLKLLDKPTLSLEQIAKKHGVSIGDIGVELTKGIKVELEHSNDRKIAKEIALDHLMELPDYYTRLDKMENESIEEAIPPSTMYKLVRKSDDVIVDQGSKAKMHKLRKAGKGEFYVGMSMGKKVGDKFKESVNEAKSGPFASKAIGNRVQIVYSKDAWDKPVEPGTEGTIVRAERVPTFSQMRPFVIQYTVETDDGQRIDIRREGVRKAKAVEEADNPFITPPSQQMPSQTMAQDDEEGTLGRKDVEDLMPGDDVEVIDIDGDPTAVKVKNPNAPGDTIVVQTDKGEEHIVKKKAVSGTPTMEELQSMYEAALGEKGRWTRIKNQDKKLGQKIKRAERVEKKKKLDHVDESGVSKDMLWDVAQEMSYDEFVGLYGEAHGELWDAANGVSGGWRERELDEVAPPGQEDWIKDRKAEFKKRYGKDWESVLYATAWKRHNNESIEEDEQLGFDFEPKPEYGTRRGDILRVQNTRQGPGLKVKGMGGLIGVGDWVELEDGRGLKIMKIGPGKKVQLDDGRFYSLSKIRYPIDESIEEALGDDIPDHVKGKADFLNIKIPVDINSKDTRTYLPRSIRGILKNYHVRSVGRTSVSPYKDGVAVTIRDLKGSSHSAEEIAKDLYDKLRFAGYNVDGYPEFRENDRSVTVRVINWSEDETPRWDLEEAADKIKPFNKMGYAPKAGSWKKRMHKAQPPENHEKTRKRHKKLREEDPEDYGPEEFKKDLKGDKWMIRREYHIGKKPYDDFPAQVLDSKEGDMWTGTKYKVRFVDNNGEENVAWYGEKSGLSGRYYDERLVKRGEKAKYIGGDSRNYWPAAGEPVPEGQNAGKTEHSGAKKGKGAYYGRKKDAKRDSNKKRRENDRKAVDETARLKQLAGIKETASGGATGAGAVAVGAVATGDVVSRNMGIYGKTTEKPKRKKRKTKEEKSDGLGRSRKE